jgi:hypothetical protein
MSASPSPNQVDPNPSPLPSLATRVGFAHGKAGALSNRSLRYTLLLGVTAGLVFSLSLWAYEAFLLIQAHVAYPWIPVLVGTILCVLACTVAALLTWLANRALLGAIFWVLTSRLIAELAVYIPLKIAPALMMILEPGLRSRLPVYPVNATLQTWAGFGTVWLAIFFLILGLLQLTLVESSVPSTTAAGRLGAYFVFIPVMVLASVMSSNMINEQLRAPLLGTNNTIQFFIDNQNTSVDPIIARQMHMSTISDISSVINRPRRLFLGQYDDYYGQVNVLIDFTGEWVNCSTVYAQPVFCALQSNP